MVAGSSSQDARALSLSGLQSQIQEPFGHPQTGTPCTSMAALAPFDPLQLQRAGRANGRHAPGRRALAASKKQAKESRDNPHSQRIHSLPRNPSAERAGRHPAPDNGERARGPPREYTRRGLTPTRRSVPPASCPRLNEVAPHSPEVMDASRLIPAKKRGGTSLAQGDRCFQAPSPGKVEAANPKHYHRASIAASPSLDEKPARAPPKSGLDSDWCASPPGR